MIIQESYFPPISTSRTPSPLPPIPCSQPTALQKYTQLVHHNAQYLSHRYPWKSQTDIRDLLLQMDNNIEATQSILDQEESQISRIPYSEDLLENVVLIEGGDYVIMREDEYEYVNRELMEMKRVLLEEYGEYRKEGGPYWRMKRELGKVEERLGRVNGAIERVILQRPELEEVFEERIREME